MGRLFFAYSLKLYLIVLADEELDRRIKITLLRSEDRNTIDSVQQVKNRIAKSVENIKKLYPYANDIITLSDSNILTVEQLIDDIIKANNPKRETKI